MGQMTVGSLITLGYGIQRFQLIGGPAWMNTDRFDINAVSEDVPVQPTLPGTPNRMQLLVRSLLKERFALKTHNETRELPLSYLVMAREDGKLGERLRPSTVDCRALFAERAKAAKEGAPATPIPFNPGEIPQCGMRGGMGQIAAGSIALSNFAQMLGSMLNRPIYDRTNLTGNFDIQLDYTPDQMPQIPAGVTLPPGVTLPSPDGPSLNTALREQLGLKLEATRGPVEVLVIDSVEPPMKVANITANAMSQGLTCFCVTSLKSEIQNAICKVQTCGPFAFAFCILPFASCITSYAPSEPLTSRDAAGARGPALHRAESERARAARP